MTTRPRRRWFRFAFSLRTLFVVVTIVGVWLGWELKIIRQRAAVRLSIESQDGHLCVARPRDVSQETCGVVVVSESLIKHATIPLVREWLGDEAIDNIVVRSEGQAQIAKAIFPEAKVFLLRR